MRGIADIESAEELFDLLGESYGQHTLRVHRVRILKRFGQEVARLEETAPLLAEEARRGLYAATLRRIHDEYARGEGPENLALVREPELVTLRRPVRRKGGG